MKKFFAAIWQHIDLVFIGIGVLLTVFKKQVAINNSTARARAGKAAKRGKTVDSNGRWVDPEPEPVIVEEELTDPQTNE